MKSSVSVIPLLLFLLNASFAAASDGAAVPDPSTYQSLVSNFETATPATQKDLTGAFVGECYTNPAYVSESAGETISGILLLGHEFSSGFYVGMLAPTENQSFDPVLGLSESQVKQSYEDNKDGDLVVLEETMSPAQNDQPVNGSFSVNGSTFEGITLKNVFRKKSGKIISEVIATDPRLPEIKGINFVCSWFERLE